MTAQRSDLVSVNSDMGEAFGLHTFGNDAALMSVIDVANVACGFHSGDPGTMDETVRLAQQNSVRVGAHPGLPDLVGFGRREMKLTPEEVESLIRYTPRVLLHPLSCLVYPANCTLLPIIAALAGLAGSLFDSLLGATVQAIYYSTNREKETEKVIDPDGTPNTPLRGWRWLDNDWVNFISSGVGAALAALLAYLTTTF